MINLITQFHLHVRLEVSGLQLSRIPSHHLPVLVQQELLVVERDARDAVGVLQPPAEIPVESMRSVSTSKKVAFNSTPGHATPYNNSFQHESQKFPAPAAPGRASSPRPHTLRRTQVRSSRQKRAKTPRTAVRLCSLPPNQKMNNLNGQYKHVNYGSRCIDRLFQIA